MVIRVMVLCPNARREVVNLTPNSCVLQILEEACQKQKLNPDDFDLCHYNKPLDLTLPVRFANIPNNAQLELRPAKSVRKDCLVTVGLQLESGERIMKDFVPSSSVWDVMEQCLDMHSEKINMDEKGEPVCIYMRQKLIGDDLKSTTLRSLGLTKGSAIIRLMYRNPSDLSDQAHVSSPLTKPPKQEPVTPNVSENIPLHINNNNNNTATAEMECDPPIVDLQLNSVDNINRNQNVPDIATGKMSSSVVVKNEIKENVCDKEEKEMHESSNKLINSLSVTSPVEKKTANESIISDNRSEGKLPAHQEMELDSNTEADEKDEEIGPIHYIGGRHAVIYSLNDITSVKKADLPDEFYDLTIEDAKYLMEEYKKARREMENQPLLTKELRERNILKKLGRFKQTVIRVYFPEKLVLQAVFDAQETVQDVCDFIRNYLDDAGLNFYLYTAPPKEKKDPTKTLIESMLIPAAVMYFGCDKHLPSYLMSSLKEKISDPRAASLAANDSRKQAVSTEFDDVDISDTSEEMQAVVPETTAQELKVPGPNFSQPPTSVKSSENVPKWLKLSRK